MLTTTTIHEEITEKIIGAIESGQTPPWRRPIFDRDIDGSPAHPSDWMPYRGVNVLILNMSATANGYRSRFWASEAEWARLGCEVTGQATILADGTPVFHADQTLLCLSSVAYRSRKRWTPIAVDYGPAEAVIKASGATIHHRATQEAAYYYPPNDYIVFPLKEQFLNGPGGLPGYFDSLLHELAHFSEPRLGWHGTSIVRELRAEIAAPFLTAQLGVGVLSDTKMLTNHRNHLSRWIKAMKHDPTLIFNVTADASKAVDYLLLLRG